MSSIQKKKIRKLQIGAAEKIQACWRGHRTRHRLMRARKDFESIFVETEQAARDSISSMNAIPLPRTTLLWRNDAQCVCAPPLILNDWELQSYLKIIQKKESEPEREPVKAISSEPVHSVQMNDADGLPVVSVQGHELLRTDDIAIIALNDTLDYECYLADAATSNGKQMNESDRLLRTPGRKVAAYSPSRSSKRKPVISVKPERELENREPPQSPLIPTVKRVTTAQKPKPPDSPKMISVGNPRPSLAVYPVQQAPVIPKPIASSEVASPFPRAVLLGGTAAKKSSMQSAGKVDTTMDRFEARVARFLGSYAEPTLELSSIPEPDVESQPDRETIERELAWVKEALQSRRKYLKKN